METYGYVRVNTREQNGERQMIALRELGLEDRSAWTSSRGNNHPMIQVTDEVKYTCKYFGEPL